MSFKRKPCKICGEQIDCSNLSSEQAQDKGFQHLINNHPYLMLALLFSDMSTNGRLSSEPYK